MQTLLKGYKVYLSAATGTQQERNQDENSPLHNNEGSVEFRFNVNLHLLDTQTENGSKFTQTQD
jgi:hypothetical protein